MHGAVLLRWLSWVEQVNLPCHDDGVTFTENERLLALESLALDAGWRRLAEWPLALVLAPPVLPEEGDWSWFRVTPIRSTRGTSWKTRGSGIGWGVSTIP